MKHVVFQILAISLVFSTIFAKRNEKYRGFLIDKLCASNMIKTPNKAYEKASKHTRFCALEENCLVSECGILLKSGNYILFDHFGNKKAEELLRKMTKKNNLLIDITGSQNGERIKILSLREIK